MIIQHIRHATMNIQYAGATILLDPMLSPAGAMPPVPNSANDRANPTADLKAPVAALLEADAVLLTHTHRDHLDPFASEMLPKTVRFYCQPKDACLLREQGFQDVVPIEQVYEWDAGIRITRTSGRHGTGILGWKMGPVSGFVLQAPNEPTLYIAGDTIWCEDVENAIAEYRPDVIVLFAGAAQFLQGGSITMDKQDVVKVCRSSPDAQIVVAHMEAWNHCLLTRTELSAYLTRRGLHEKVHIPEDGENMTFTR
jgi:L-ascorbate metabolism protein UlaG (beta-lactamase superfamily)